MIRVIKIKDNFATILKDKIEWENEVKHIISNLYEVEFKGKVYRIFDYFDRWGRAYEVFEKIDLPIYSWDTLEKELKELKENFEHLQEEEQEVPAAPDTSKFIAIKDGHLEIRKNYYKQRQYWLSPDYYPYIFIIGTVITKKMSEKFWNNLFNIFASGLENGLLINEKTPRFGEILGSAWYGFGLQD